MALDSQNILGCPYCGYRVGPMETSCPRCGNGFTDLTRFECPFCGEMVRAGMRECPSCHINFTEFVTNSATIVSDQSIDTILNDIIGMESTLVKQEDRKFSCPKCSWMLQGNETTCPKCGEDLSKRTSLQCPICGAMVDAAASRCSECGTSFRSGAAVAARETKARHERVSSALGNLLETLEKAEPTPEPEKAPPIQPRPQEVVEDVQADAEAAENKPKQRKLRVRSIRKKPS